MSQLKPTERKHKFRNEHRKINFIKYNNKSITPPEPNLTTNSAEAKSTIGGSMSFWQPFSPRNLVDETADPPPPKSLNFNIFNDSYIITANSITNDPGKIHQVSCNVSNITERDSYSDEENLIFSSCQYSIYRREETSKNMTDNLRCVQSNLDQAYKDNCLFEKILYGALLGGMGFFCAYHIIKSMCQGYRERGHTIRDRGYLQVQEQQSTPHN